MNNILNKSIYLILFLAFVSCSQNDFDPITTISKGEKVESTTTVANVMSTYMTTNDFYTADRITSATPLVINGIVTSTDIEGNIYKYIAVQEEGVNGRAIRISIDASSIAAIYPLGQRVSVTLNDLCIGKYGESPQVGSYYLRPSDNRLSPGAIPMGITYKKIIAYGDADPKAVVADTMTIAQLLAAPKDKMHYRLICIKNAWFTGKGYDYGSPSTLTTANKIFAPGTNGIGFPQSREIQDGTGSSVIATSEFAKFAQFPLPASSYKGDITVLVSWYRSSSSNAGNYQLTLRTLSSLGSGFDGYLSSVNYTR